MADRQHTLSLIVEAVNRSDTTLAELEGQVKAVVDAAAKAADNVGTATDRISASIAGSIEPFNNALNSAAEMIEGLGQKIDKMAEAVSGFTQVQPAIAGMAEGLDGLNAKIDVFEEKIRTSAEKAIGALKAEKQVAEELVQAYAQRAEKAGLSVDRGQLPASQAPTPVAPAPKPAADAQFPGAPVTGGDAFMKGVYARIGWAGMGFVLPDATRRATEANTVAMGQMTKKMEDFFKRAQEPVSAPVVSGDNWFSKLLSWFDSKGQTTQPIPISPSVAGVGPASGLAPVSGKSPAQASDWLSGQFDWWKTETGKMFRETTWGGLVGEWWDVWTKDAGKAFQATEKAGESADSIIEKLRVHIAAQEALRGQTTEQATDWISQGIQGEMERKLRSAEELYRKKIITVVQYGQQQAEIRAEAAAKLDMLRQASEQRAVEKGEPIKPRVSPGKTQFWQEQEILDAFRRDEIDADERDKRLKDIFGVIRRKKTETTEREPKLLEDVFSEFGRGDIDKEERNKRLKEIMAERLAGAKSFDREDTIVEEINRGRPKAAERSGVADRFPSLDMAKGNNIGEQWDWWKKFAGQLAYETTVGGTLTETWNLWMAEKDDLKRVMKDTASSGDKGGQPGIIAAETWAAAGKDLKDFQAAWQRIVGGEIPETAKKAFGDVQKKLKEVFQEEQTESFYNRIGAEVSGGAKKVEDVGKRFADEIQGEAERRLRDLEGEQSFTNKVKDFFKTRLGITPDMAKAQKQIMDQAAQKQKALGGAIGSQQTEETGRAESWQKHVDWLNAGGQGLPADSSDRVASITAREKERLAALDNTYEAEKKRQSLQKQLELDRIKVEDPDAVKKQKAINDQFDADSQKRKLAYEKSLKGVKDSDPQAAEKKKAIEDKYNADTQTRALAHEKALAAIKMGDPQAAEKRQLIEEKFQKEQEDGLKRYHEAQKQIEAEAFRQIEEYFNARLQLVRNYFQEQQMLQQAAQEAERTAIWQNAANKEQAEKQIKALGLKSAQERISLLEGEYLAEKRIRDEKTSTELGRVTGDDKDAQQKRQELQDKATQGEAEALLKYQQEMYKLVADMNKQLQDLYKQRMDLVQRMGDASRDAILALDQVAAKSRNEWQNLQERVKQAASETQRAIDLLPTQPEKAMEIAKAARSQWAALAQDIIGVKKEMANTADWYRSFYREAYKKETKMTRSEAFTYDMEEVQRLRQEAEQALTAGDTKRAEERIKQARELDAQLYRQGPADRREEAKTEMGRIEGAEKRIQAATLKNAEDTNAKVSENIGKLNEIIETGLQQALQRNTQAIEDLTNAVRGTEAKAKEVKAGASAAAREAGKTGSEVPGVPSNQVFAGKGPEGTGPFSSPLGIIGDIGSALAKTFSDLRAGVMREFPVLAEMAAGEAGRPRPVPGERTTEAAIYEPPEEWSATIERFMQNFQEKMRQKFENASLHAVDFTEQMASNLRDNMESVTASLSGGQKGPAPAEDSQAFASAVEMFQGIVQDAAKAFGQPVGVQIKVDSSGAVTTNLTGGGAYDTGL